MSGHLEPRQHPDWDHRQLAEDKWGNLLDDGVTFDRKHPWIESVMNDGEPDDALLKETCEGELRLHVFDFVFQQKLSGKLRWAIHHCYDGLKNMNIEIYRRTTDKDMRQIGEEAQERAKRFLRIKQLLCDGKEDTKTTEEQRREDTLDSAKEIQKWMNDKYEGQKNLDLSPAERGGAPQLVYDVLGALKGRQNKIIALTRLLILPTMLQRQLSTRNAGMRVALAWVAKFLRKWMTIKISPVL